MVYIIKIKDAWLHLDSVDLELRTLDKPNIAPFYKLVSELIGERIFVVLQVAAIQPGKLSSLLESPKPVKAEKDAPFFIMKLSSNWSLLQGLSAEGHDLDQEAIHCIKAIFPSLVQGKVLLAISISLASPNKLMALAYPVPVPESNPEYKKGKKAPVPLSTR